MALHRLCIGEISPEAVREALNHPEKEADFGVAQTDWLMLWGVHWEHLPLDSTAVNIQCFSAPPVGPTVERTMRKRWREAARHEMKSLLHNEWARLCELPIVKHR